MRAGVAAGPDHRAQLPPDSDPVVSFRGAPRQVPLTGRPVSACRPVHGRTTCRITALRWT